MAAASIAGMRHCPHQQCLHHDNSCGVLLCLCKVTSRLAEAEQPLHAVMSWRKPMCAVVKCMLQPPHHLRTLARQVSTGTSGAWSHTGTITRVLRVAEWPDESIPVQVQPIAGLQRGPRWPARTGLSR
jgi:hypothetical protein